MTNEIKSAVRVLREAFVTYMTCPTVRNYDALLEAIPAILDIEPAERAEGVILPWQNRMPDAVKQIGSTVSQIGYMQEEIDELRAAIQPAGEVDSYSNMDSLQQQSEAWIAVVDALNETRPGWQHGDGTGIEMAVAAIRAMPPPVSAPVPEASTLQAELVFYKKAHDAVSGKLSSVWKGISDMVERYTGKPCGKEPFDDLEAIMFHTAPVPEAKAEQGEIRVFGNTGDGVLVIPAAPAVKHEASELVQRLREYAAEPGYSHGDYADTMRQAADALDARSPVAAPDTSARDEDGTDLAEGLEILDNLISSIEQHGNYSKDATLTFLSQLRQCLATAASSGEKGGAA